MEKYSISIRKSAKRELGKLQKKDLQRIIKRIKRLAKDPRPMGCEKLSDQEKYRIRQGDYRIIYSIQDHDKTIWITKIGDRKEVYRS